MKAARSIALVALLLGTALPVGADRHFVEDREVSWETREKAFVSTAPLSRDDQVRIRIRKPGKGRLELIQWRGKSKKKKKGVDALASWSRRDVRKLQVVRHTVRQPMRLGLRVMGEDGRRETKERLPQSGYDQLSFSGGWIVDVKIVDDEF